MVAAYLPALQSLQAVAPEAAYLPVGQEVQPFALVAPAPDTLPAGQAVHDELPVAEAE